MAGKASDLEQKLGWKISHIKRLGEAIDMLDPERMDVRMLQANKFRVAYYNLERYTVGRVGKVENGIELITIPDGVNLYNPDDIVLDKKTRLDYNVYAGGEFRLPTPLAERIMDCMEENVSTASHTTHSPDPESRTDDKLYEMKMGEKMSYGEIAKKTGLTRNQVKGRIRRFKKSLPTQPETPENHLRTNT